MRILIIGGTRMVGYHLLLELAAAGHEVVLFNRGKTPATLPEGVSRILGDRDDIGAVESTLALEQFDAIFDTSGRSRAQTELFAEIFRGQIAHFVYISSAGVYSTSEQWPLTETSPLDPKSRHKGKAETDLYLLADPELRATSLRPVYIYGPRNYNDIEAWFFDRLLRDRPVLIPGDGQTITQLGHGQDLARAGLAILGNEKALGQVYNLSGAEYITFTGLALACAQACGKEAKLVYFDSAKYAHLGRKFFPLRQQHFFSSIAKAERDLNWTPQFSLAQGLADSLSWYQSIGRHETTVDFSADDALLAALDG